jgi:hypothetical protein
MDVSEYRRRYEAELEEAAARQVGFRELAARPPSAAATADLPATAPPDEDDLAAAVAVLRDRDAEPRLQAEALRVIGIELAERPELVDTLLELLTDRGVPDRLREQVMDELQQLSFRMVLVPGRRPAYLAALRSIVEDPDARLRRRAIGILAREKDEYVQRLLVDGLEHRRRALVPAAKAVQFLGYDVHAEHLPLLRRIVEQPPSRAARREAVRLLAIDPGSRELLLSVLRDQAERSDIRRSAAVALQSLAPEQFLEEARRIVLKEGEDDQLQAQCISALALFANPAELGQDADLARRVEGLRSASGSRQVRRAAADYLARHGAG